VTVSIHLGYEVGTGEAIEIPLRHTAVTGQTQESGKTTTLEALIHRSGLCAVAYVTKRGESSFHVMNPIPPYFQERADWKFVQSLLEASTEQKLKFEQAWIMRASDGARTLEDVRANIAKFLAGVRDTRPVKRRKGAEVKERWLTRPARGLSSDIYFVLQKYFDDIMPQIKDMPYSTKLELAEGLNVMDLRDYEFPLQALVVRSVLDWTRGHGENVINVIPEAWRFAPKFRGSPVRQSAEELIREGGALKNFLWIDSQDLAGVADVLMRQVGVWFFGVQRAKHEIERALDHMPEGLPVRRPRAQDIATLSKGQFYVCFGREMHKVYVQPAWMKAAHAEAIARGEEEVDSAREILREYDKGAKRGARDLQAARARQIRKGDAEDLPSSETVSVSRMREETNPGQSRFASDRDARRGHDSTDPKPQEDEDMWKEKYEALKKEYDLLEGSYKHIVSDLPEKTTGVIGSYQDGDLDKIYRYVKDRALLDPRVLQSMRETPELRVKIERPVVTAEPGTLFASVCQLVSEGFFKDPKGAKLATAEAVRRGFCHPKTPAMRLEKPLDELARMGFLTRESEGYQSVPGMKVNIVEG
jgi:hypothetical protein